MTSDRHHHDGDVPEHAGGVRLVATEGGGELHAEHLAEPLLLDAMALALWDLCDSETSLGEMVRASLQLFDAQAGVVGRDIERALDALAAAGLLTWRAATAGAAPVGPATSPSEWRRPDVGA